MNFHKTFSLITTFSILLPISAKAADISGLSHEPDILNDVAGQVLDNNHPSLLGALGLGIGESLSKIRSHTTTDGREVTRLNQTYRGVPVWGHQVILHRDLNGHIRAIKGNSVTGIVKDVPNVRPSIAESLIVARIRQQVLDHISGNSSQIQREKSELVIYVDDNETAHLAYALEFLADSEKGGHPTRPMYLIDANSGDLLKFYDALAHQEPDCLEGCELLNETNLSGSGATRGKNAQPATFDMYSISIPSSSPDGSKLTISLSGGSGDADLYVKLGEAPTTSNYDCRPYLTGNNESCVQMVSAGQTWHIGIYAYSSFSSVSLNATLTPPVVVEKIGDGPGGNEKTGIYYYGVDYSSLSLKTDNNSCEMTTDNVKTVHLHNGTTGNTAYTYSDGSNCYQDADSANGAYSPLNDAHYFGGVVYDMYQDYLNVAPLTFQLTMRVHYSTNYENAFWDGQAMTFGDGQNYFYPLVSLDVSSHEVSHGFTEQNSGLVYSGQSGGMNEAFSDIAGEAAEFFMKGEADFKVGADIFKGNGALRYMDNPTLDGSSIAHVDDYYNGLDVHYSSGIFNKAFYELAVTQGWGVKKAFQVFAWANMNCWTSSSTFQAGAQCVADEAMNHDSTENPYPGIDVIKAFSTVGITLSLPAAPDQPTNVSANAMSYQQIDLAWNSVTNITGYNILRLDNSTYTLLNSVGSTVTQYSDTGLQPETEYSYKIVAVNDTGSNESATVSATTQSAPATPDISLSGTAFKNKGFNMASLEWDNIAATTLKIDDGTTINNISVSGTSYTHNTMQKGGMTLTYQVCNTDNCSNSVTLIW